MTNLEWLGLVFASALGAIYALFRRGGVYNPRSPDDDIIEE